MLGVFVLQMDSSQVQVPADSHPPHPTLGVWGHRSTAPPHHGTLQLACHGKVPQDKGWTLLLLDQKRDAVAMETDALARWKSWVVTTYEMYGFNISTIVSTVSFWLCLLNDKVGGKIKRTIPSTSSVLPSQHLLRTAGVHRASEPFYPGTPQVCSRWCISVPGDNKEEPRAWLQYCGRNRIPGKSL